MLKNGTFAVAVVHRQVVVVQAARSHTKRDKYLDVHTFSPFGEGIFLASEVPAARIASNDVLSVLSDEAAQEEAVDSGMLHLTEPAFSEYRKLSERNVKRHESLWKALVQRRY
ncbi:hypothetical protein FA15DRAFT_668275 [Coprinopsis marcescibilis]|uniref:Uncharacterized protein n=1 Tax=Coprinopsis marcescibilis TaxID=230819 RepID=A0A5C3KY50_COPMA|nr:hypothetical protein FA15DRAFT_668275 [Coprinopsis marcescibilis]